MPDIDQRWCRPGRRKQKESRQHANFQMVVKVFDLCHGGILPLYTLDLIIVQYIKMHDPQPVANLSGG